MNKTETPAMPLWAVELRKFRRLRDITQSQFGEWFGVTQQAVALWETGTVEPPVAVLAWLVDQGGRLDA